MSRRILDPDRRDMREQRRALAGIDLAGIARDWLGFVLSRVLPNSAETLRTDIGRSIAGKRIMGVGEWRLMMQALDPEARLTMARQMVVDLDLRVELLDYDPEPLTDDEWTDELQGLQSAAVEAYAHRHDEGSTRERLRAIEGRASRLRRLPAVLAADGGQMTAQPTLIACAPVLPYVCETCGSACADAVHAPGEWLGGDAVYRYEPGPMQCSRCSRVTWRAHLERVRAVGC